VLAIAHWVMQADPQAAANVEQAIAAAQDWQLGQQNLFSHNTLSELGSGCTSNTGSWLLDSEVRLRSHRLPIPID